MTRTFSMALTVLIMALFSFALLPPTHAEGMDGKCMKCQSEKDSGKKSAAQSGQHGHQTKTTLKNGQKKPRIDGCLAFLKAELHIREDQETTWLAYSETLRTVLKSKNVQDGKGSGDKCQGEGLVDKGHGKAWGKKGQSEASEHQGHGVAANSKGQSEDHGKAWGKKGQSEASEHQGHGVAADSRGQGEGHGKAWGKKGQSEASEHQGHAGSGGKAQDKASGMKDCGGKKHKKQEKAQNKTAPEKLQQLSHKLEQKIAKMQQMQTQMQKLQQSTAALYETLDPVQKKDADELLIRPCNSFF